MTCEDGVRDGGIGMTIEDRIGALAPSTVVEVLGTPTRFLPHDGRPERILAQLGLDADGIAAAVRRLADSADASLAVELELALELADAADAITLPPFLASDVAVEWKVDRTEVTALDRAAEAAIAERLAADRPHHRLLGEEHGRSGDASSPWQWIVDPIDGTSGYVRGIPVWATLIALAHDDDVVVAVVSAPALGRRWWATAGGGTFADGRRCRVSTVAAVADAQVSVTLDRRLGRPRPDAGARRPRRGRPAGPRLRRLLAARPRRRGRARRGDRRGRGRRLRHRRRAPARRGGRRHVHRPPRRGDPRHDTAISTNGLLHAEVLRRLTPGPASP